jgi:hypothetical protein
MMKIPFAHVRERSTVGGWINFIVLDARSTSGNTGDNASLLAQLTIQAKALRLQVDQSALAFMSRGQLQFYGTKNLVDYLSKRGLPRSTHELIC